MLKDTVRREIHDRNRVYSNKGLPTLNLILKGDLLKDFIEIHGRFLPSEPADFRRFLELYLSDGIGLLQGQQFSNFLLSVLPLGGKAMKKLEVERALASALILAGYVLSPYTEKRNSISLINGWVILAAHVLAVAGKARLPKKNWVPTFELCISAIEHGFKDLLDEVFKRDNFAEGDPFTDGLFYRARMTLVLGYLAAFENYLFLKGEASESTEAVKKFVDAQKSYLLLWGESAVPVFLSGAWFLERQAKQLEAEQLISSVVHAIITQNNPQNKTRGLHDPYHSIEAVMRVNFGLDPNDLGQEKFVGHSFGLQSAVEWLARRLRRQTLARMWPGITRISFCEFTPEPQWAIYLWTSAKGELKNRFPNRPESWKDLAARAQSKEYTLIPELLKQMPSFLSLFLLVYPHRVRPDLVSLLDHNLF